MRKCWSLLSTLALISGCSSPADAARYVHPDQSNIRMIDCGNYIGTMWVVGKNTLVTAEHVIKGRATCTDDTTGKVVTIVETDHAHDYALLKMDTTGLAPVKYSCDRLSTGTMYQSYGYGKGVWSIVPLQASPYYTPKGTTIAGMPDDRSGMRVLEGSIIPGQSGGPILDKKGVAHAFNNASNPQYSLSYELVDTPLCASPIAQPLHPLFLDKSLP